jgi:hypothetical protein
MHSLIVGANIRGRDMGNRRVRRGKGRKNDPKNAPKNEKRCRKEVEAFFASFKKRSKNDRFPKKSVFGVLPCSQKTV